MIQRIQSIFLLLAAGCIAALYNFPFATSDTATGEFLSDKTYNLLDSVFLLVFAAISISLSLATIFMYKKRKIQLKMSTLNIVSIILFIVLIIFLFYQEFIGSTSTTEIEDGIGIYFPFGALIFAILASRNIKKDVKIVKSMDRLR